MTDFIFIVFVFKEIIICHLLNVKYINNLVLGTTQCIINFISVYYWYPLKLPFHLNVTLYNIFSLPENISKEFIDIFKTEQ